MASSRWIAAALGLAVVCACAAAPAPVPAIDQRPSGDQRPSADDALLDELEHRTFDYFWKTANPDNGLVPDRYPTPSFSSIAAVGFGLTAYAIGAERGYVTRAAARDRVRTTLAFFRDAPQGNAASGVTGYKGFYYHFLDMKTGHRFKDVELSSVDTALLLGGVLFCREYFSAATPEEQELRAVADALLERVDWRWMQARAPAIAMGWTPEGGFLDYDWIGYNEGMIVILLALGSPTFAVEPSAWERWSSRYRDGFGLAYGQIHLRFPPLFGHQYSHLWVDFRQIRDPFMAAHGLDYFENTRRATYAQQAYAVANPDGWVGYGANVWGLTASDGPGDMTLTIGGKPRTIRGYAARGMASYDDGTIAPTALVSSLPFAPEIAMPGIRELLARYGKQIYREYGFADAFNPSFPASEKPATGSVVPGAGWVDVDYLGIDQGPIIGMIENHRSGLVWKVMRGSGYLRRGLVRAGFTGGWLSP